MSNWFTRLFQPSVSPDVMADLYDTAPPEPVPYPCTKCKGIFTPEGLAPVSILIIGANDIPRLSVVSYCQACKPPTSFGIVMEDNEGDALSSLSFRVSDGWIQPVDEESGEDSYLVTPEAYNHLFCEQCGGESTWTKCRACQRKAKK